MAGTSLDKLQLDEGDEIKKKVFSFSLSFVFGFSTVFVILGASATLLSNLVYEYLDFLRIAGGIIIIIFGIHFMQIVQVPFLNREMRYQIESYRPGVVGSYIIGLSFAFGWTPCIGPILGSVLSIAASSEDSNVWNSFTNAVFSRLRHTFSNSGLCNKWLYEIFIKNKKLYKINRNFYWSFTNFIWYPDINKQNSRIGFLFIKYFPFLAQFG